MIRWVFTWVFAVLWVACSGPSVRKSTEHASSHPAPLLPGMTQAETPMTAPEPEDDPTAAVSESETEDEASAPEDADDSEDESKTASSAPKKHQIPFEFNHKVAEWIQYFSQNDRERFQRFLDRAEPYREVVENILEENGVPADLYYLGLIESGFATHAQSHAKAVGVWQFMRTTGKSYGLTTDAYVDERRDPVRATEAAAKMMRDLHQQFGSWYLAMAAYNAGAGRVRGAVRRGGSRDYWELAAKKKLPKETVDYVPKYIAARYIGENPDLFAFYLSEEKKYPNVERVEVPSPVTFESIEKVAGIPKGTLSFVNPQYLRPYTHPARMSDEIWVPEAYVQAVKKHRPDLRRIKLAVRTTRHAKASVYHVKRGDTLKSIALKQGLSVAYLRRVNGLKSSKIQPGQTLELTASSYRERRSHPRKKHIKRK